MRGRTVLLTEQSRTKQNNHSLFTIFQRMIQPQGASCRIAQGGFFVASVCAAYMALPVMGGVLPGGVSALLPQPAVALAAPLPVPGRNDPGVQLNQAREYLERQMVERQIEEDRESRKAKVETEVQAPENTAAQVSFTLSKVEIDTSEVLSAEELHKITESYIGKTVTLQDLYAITGSINNLYVDKGYQVCRAYLPPQRIHEGTVQIKLLEGKTGLVTVKGLKKTREGYVLHRIPLKPGTVANTDRLTKQLQLFNGTNDVQLRVLVHAGEQPGTTDYEIQAYEPKQNQAVTLYVDSNGYESSGRVREGVFYNVRSLTGARDSLHMNYLHSTGTDMFGAGYSLPVSHKGTRLDLDYSTNSTEIRSGDMASLNPKGHAYSAGVTLRHPLRVDGKRRYEAGLQYLNQKAETDLRSFNDKLVVKWVDDRRNTFSPFVSFTHYGDSSVLYHKHSLPFTSWTGKGLGGDISSNYFSYQLNMLYQKRYKHGQMFSARLDGQMGDSKDRPSSDLFYLGGSNSVRGYEESFIGGNKGAALGLTYQTPLNKKQNVHAFTFFDYGWVSNDNDKDASSYSAYSTGLGLSASYKNVYASVTLGIPLKREYGFTTKKVSNTRFDFVCSATF